MENIISSLIQANFLKPTIEYLFLTGFCFYLLYLNKQREKDLENYKKEMKENCKNHKEEAQTELKEIKDLIGKLFDRFTEFNENVNQKFFELLNK